MLRVYDFDDYKDFVRARLKLMPKKGHGQWLKIAHHVGIHTTMVSQIFKGNLDLSLEQAQKLTVFLGMNESEADFFSRFSSVGKGRDS